MTKIKIGILGCANIAERMVIPAILKSSYFELEFVSSRTEEKAKRFAEFFNVKYVAGYDSLLEQDIDAVYIPLPTGMHYEWIIKALNSGLHVLSEKSIATNLNDVDGIITLAEKNGLIVHENFMFVHHSQNDFVKSKMKEIGSIRQFRSSFGFPKFKDNTNFRYNKSLGGGSLLDVGAYTLKGTQLFIDEKQKVLSSTLNNLDTEVDFLGTITLQSESNVISQLSFGFDNFYQNNIEIWGTKGKITMNRAYTAGPGFMPSVLVESQGIKTEYTLPSDNHFIKSIEHFAQAITNSDNSEHRKIINQARLINQVFNNAK